MAELHPLELFTLGTPTARVGGAPPPPDVLWRKNLALIIYLSLSPDGARTRDHLIGLLWPEKADARARHSLNEAVRRLRGSLGADRLQSQGETITLNHEGLTVDSLQFQQATDRVEALSYFKGDFLEGFSLADAPAFETWVAGERERFRARGVKLLLEATDEALTNSEFEKAADNVRRALALKTFSEPAANLLMRALALAGDSAGALEAYAGFSDRLKDELDESPSRDLSDLADRIRSERWHRVAAQYADVEPLLVGRQSIHQRAFALLSEARTGLRGLAINADPGMGRTRLVAECADRWSLDGGTVVVARPLESDHDAPWSTLRSLARAGLGKAPGIAGTDPDELAVLASLTPDIASAATPREPRDVAQVSAALAALLNTVAEEQPLMMGIDDAHFADPITLEALYGALRQVEGAPIFFALTSLEHVPDAPRKLLRLRGEIGRAIPGGAVRLAPLSQAEIHELVAASATWCENEEELDRLSRRIGFETGGSPFLAVTLLRGLEHAVTLREDVAQWPPQNHTMERPLPISIPDLARMAIMANVSALPSEARDLLGSASILDLALDIDLLEQLTGSSTNEVEKQLAVLERYHIIVFDGDRYAFTAPLIAQVARSEFLTPGMRKGLRLRAIDALGRREDLESRVLEIELRAKVEGGKDVATEAAQVARVAKGSGAHRTVNRAIRAVERALRHSSETDRQILETLRADLAT